MESLYNKKFVYYNWDDSLEGKNVFLADYIGQLEDIVNNNLNQCKVTKSNLDKPFSRNESTYTFCYYDPNYKFKYAWLKENKKVFYRIKAWVGITNKFNPVVTDTVEFFDNNNFEFSFCSHQESEILKEKVREAVKKPGKYIFGMKGINGLVEEVVIITREGKIPEYLIGQYSTNVDFFGEHEYIDLNKMKFFTDWNAAFEYFNSLADIGFFVER